MHRFTLPAHVMGATIEFARGRGVTVMAVLLAAWATLLHRYSNQARPPHVLILGSHVTPRDPPRDLHATPRDPIRPHATPCDPT
eukprot:1322957-Prymnesium_polylepis.1